MSKKLTKDDIFAARSLSDKRKTHSQNITSSDDYKSPFGENYDGDKSESTFFEDKSINKKSESSGVHLSFLQHTNTFTIPEEDKGDRAYWMMMLFGVACLLPWNAVLTSLDFFYENIEDMRPFTVFGFVVNLVQLFSSVMNILYG